MSILIFMREFTYTRYYIAAQYTAAAQSSPPPFMDFLICFELTQIFMADTGIENSQWSIRKQAFLVYRIFRTIHSLLYDYR